MNILAVESSTSACSVSLLSDENQKTEFTLAPQKHADLMLPMVNTLMSDMELSGDSLDMIAYSNGPGAFTGIRIATGVAQGLALGWDKPVIGVSPLEAIGWEVLQKQPDQKVLVCLDARMKEIYAQLCWVENDQFCSEAVNMYSESNLLQQITLLKSKYGHLIGAGDIEKEYSSTVHEFEEWNEVLPSAKGIARIALQRQQDAKSVDEEIPLPVYLRNNVAEKTVDRLKKKQKES